jgi:hypothetical protein
MTKLVLPPRIIRDSRHIARAAARAAAPSLGVASIESRRGWTVDDDRRKWIGHATEDFR